MTTETTEEFAGGHDEEAFLQFVERFASVLAEGGWPQMPARVFVCLLTVDSGKLTAAELAEKLRVSPAAISGAVRYLGQVNLVSRERDPGSRRDVYRVHDDVWYETAVSKDKALTRWEVSLREGIELLGADSAAGKRMSETLEFFEFVQQELPNLLDRWRELRTELRAERPAKS